MEIITQPLLHKKVAKYFERCLLRYPQFVYEGASGEYANFQVSASNNLEAVKLRGPLIQISVNLYAHKNLKWTLTMTLE